MGGSVPAGGSDYALKAAKYLLHHGVKGMHWGVRKKSAQEPAHGDAKRTQRVVERARASGTTAISNKDLQTAISRMQLERQFNEVRPKTTSEQVTRWLARTLLKIGQEQASSLARNAATEQVKSAMKK